MLKKVKLLVTKIKLHVINKHEARKSHDICYRVMKEKGLAIYAMCSGKYYDNELCHKCLNCPWFTK